MANDRTAAVTNYTLEMFNSIRNDPNSGLNMLPAATVTSIGSIKAVLDADPNKYNSYVGAMLKRIGQTIVETPDFTDPYTRFYKTNNEMSHMVQQVYIEPIKATGAFNANGTNPLGRRTLTGVHVAYYDTNYQPEYAITIDRVGMMDAFASWDKLDDYWGAVMRAMYTGESFGRFAAEQKVINDAIADTTKALASAYIGTFTAKDDAAGRAFVQSLKYVVNDICYPNTMNIAKVTNVAKRNQLVLLLHKDIKANIDVYTLASLFNADKADIDIRIIPVQSFDNRAMGSNGSPTGTNANANVIGLLTTPEFFQFRRTMTTTRSIENPQGLFHNHFYHPWCSLQIGQFAPAVVFRTGTAPAS